MSLIGGKADMATVANPVHASRVTPRAKIDLNYPRLSAIRQRLLTGTLAPLSSTSCTIPAKVFICPSRISIPEKVAGVCCARDFRARVADSSSGAKNILSVILSLALNHPPMLR
jgi:hypothetical protein